MINPYIIYKDDEFYQKTMFSIKPVARPDGLVLNEHSSQVNFLLQRHPHKIKRKTQIIYRKGILLPDWGTLAGNLTLGIDMDEGTAAIKSQEDVLGIAWVNDDTGELVEWDPNENIE